jgi:enoyl-CoA hydratase/carnithine racemase
VAILTGAGNTAFCAGADLSSAGGHRANDVVVGRKHFAGFVNALRSKPWIAAVRGFALGGGTELALACELVVAGQSANFGLPEVQRSLMAAAGGLIRLPRTVPERVAMEMILTGEPITAARALELHLVNQVVTDDAVLDAALALAARVASAAPKAVQESLLIARRSREDQGKLLADGGAAIGRVLQSADFREGMAAFMQKRKPVWKGR